jgi:hypothetical protein
VEEERDDEKDDDVGYARLLKMLVVVHSLVVAGLLFPGSGVEVRKLS